MSIITRTVAKSHLETGDKPSQSQMSDIMDSIFFDEDMLRYKADAWTDFANKIGTNIPLQPHLMNKRIIALIPAAEGTNPTLIGMSNTSNTGTITAPAAFSSASHRGQFVRTMYRSAGTAGATASFRANNASWIWRGNAARRGGFTASYKFAIPVQPSGYIFFCGLRNSSAAIGATTEASALVDLVAIGKDSGDTTLQFLHNDNVDACTKVNTTVTPDTDTIYQLIMHCEPNGSTIYYILIEVATGAILASHSATTNLPLNTTGGSVLRPIQHISNNAQATAVDCETGGFYIEANN